MLTEILEALYPALATILTGAVSLGSARLFSWLGVEMQDKEKRAFDEAVVRAALWAVGGRRGAVITSAELDGMAATAADYLEQNVPDKVKRLGASRDGLKTRAKIALSDLVKEQ